MHKQGGNMEKRKILKIILVIGITLAVLFLGFVVYKKIQYENSMITGSEYMTKQEEYIQNFESFYKILDDVVLMGITNGIDDEQYRFAICACAESLLLMEKEYSQYNEIHPLRQETANEFQIDAFVAVYDMYVTTHGLVYAMYDGFTSEDELVYTYLTYKQSITNSLDDYIKARDMNQKTTQ